jgi:hypothetical protein
LGSASVHDNSTNTQLSELWGDAGPSIINIGGVGPVDDDLKSSSDDRAGSTREDIRRAGCPPDFAPMLNFSTASLAFGHAAGCARATLPSPARLDDQVD